jgi:hypothetical protein
VPVVMPGLESDEDEGRRLAWPGEAKLGFSGRSGLALLLFVCVCACVTACACGTSCMDDYLGEGKYRTRREDRRKGGKGVRKDGGGLLLWTLYTTPRHTITEHWCEVARQCSAH